MRIDIKASTHGSSVEEEWFSLSHLLSPPPLELLNKNLILNKLMKLKQMMEKNGSLKLF